MADFRKWLLAFAGVVLMLSTSSSVQGATTGPATCTVSSPGSLVRSEGYTELTGDIVLDCTGGTQTSAGSQIPQVNITVAFANTNITSRLNPTNAFHAGNGSTLVPSEALLLIDEPVVNGGATNPPTTPQAGQPPYKPCTSLTGCAGVGAGPGGDVYVNNGVPSAYEGVLSSKTGLVPGSLNGFSGVTFLGVPIDAPGTTGHRIIRITNLRADAVTASGGNPNITGLLPITANVSIGNTSSISLTTTQGVTVAFVVQGLKQANTTARFTQCNPAVGGPGVTLAEGFSYSFKPRISKVTGGKPAFPSGTDTAQDVPGLSNFYFTESGFTTSTKAGDIGVADSGTRFIITLGNLQNGVSVKLDNMITSTVTPSLILALVPTADANGGGGAPVTTAGTTTVTGTYAGGATASNTSVTYEVVAANGNVPESITIPMAVSFPAGQTSSNIPFTTPAGTKNLLVNNFSTITVSFAPSTTATVAHAEGWNEPQDPVGADLNWIPRFTRSTLPSNGIQILPCSCNLLYPFVTSQLGYDTGLTIANTSMDPFGGFTDKKNAVAANAGQTGAVTFYFFGNSVVGTTNTPVFSLPEAGVTKALTVPPGCTLAFDLKGNFTTNPSGVTGNVAALTLPGCDVANTKTGGSAANNYLINGTATATPMENFQGYVIATATFQYCHGEAFILGGAATGLNGSGGAFYNAIELDTPFWAGSLGATTQRTGQFGESQGN